MAQGRWPRFEPDEVAAAIRILETGRVNYWTGDEGRAFERDFAAATSTACAVALANGTVALELALRALWSPGALRTPANIVHVSIAATAFAGAAILAALGLFQIAASRFAADARRINLHPPASRPEARRDDSNVDWSTRA